MLVFNGSTKECVDFFERYYEEFKPVKKLTAFFDNENFILTPYNLENGNIKVILENEQGNQMQLSGLNCGYGGTGPNGTRTILERLGVSNELAERWMYYRALCVCFEQDGSFYRSEKLEFFGEQEHDESILPCRLSEYTKADVMYRTVYMITPSYQNMNGYLSCLNMMKPEEVQYSVGGASIEIKPMIDMDSFEFMYRNIPDKYRVANFRINLSITGQRFDLVACLAEEEIVPLVNLTHMYLMKKPIQDEYLRRFCSIPQYQSNWLQQFRSIFVRQPKEYSGRFEIPLKKW